MANNKNKINSKRANQISLIISTIYFIYMFINGLVLKPTGDDVVYWCIICLIGTCFVYLIFYYIIFRGDDKAREEEEKRIKVEIRQYLSNTDYKQVFLIYEKGDKMAMIEKIMKKEEWKFYAKLTENNNIHLVVKDKMNEELYSEEIENFFYFSYNFKFK